MAASEKDRLWRTIGIGFGIGIGSEWVRQGKGNFWLRTGGPAIKNKKKDNLRAEKEAFASESHFCATLVLSIALLRREARRAAGELSRTQICTLRGKPHRRAAASISRQVLSFPVAKTCNRDRDRGQTKTEKQSTTRTQAIKRQEEKRKRKKRDPPKRTQKRPKRPKDKKASVKRAVFRSLAPPPLPFDNVAAWLCSSCVFLLHPSQLVLSSGGVFCPARLVPRPSLGRHPDLTTPRWTRAASHRATTSL